MSLFFLDTPRVRGAQGGKPVGEITFKKKTAERKSEAEVVWEQVAMTSPLYNGDSIRTVQEARATIRLKDGTEIDLVDESLIILDFSDDAVNINFQHGHISAKKNAGGQKVRLTTSEGTVSLGTSKGEVSVSKGEKQEGLKLVVSEGRAEIAGKSGKAVVDEGRSATLGGGAKTIKIEKANLQTLIPAANAWILTESALAGVDFSWKNPEKIDLELVVAGDRDMKKIEAR
ncbi:MAG: FecR domain-containing protein, partial [Spirochaetia bacterium]|nr:FecR domain-containing protein [Spirochaetia bacterium]